MCYVAVCCVCDVPVLCVKCLVPMRHVAVCALQGLEEALPQESAGVDGGGEWRAASCRVDLPVVLVVL